MTSDRQQGYIKNTRYSAGARGRRARLLSFFALVVLFGVFALWRAPLGGVFWGVAGPLLERRDPSAGTTSDTALNAALLLDRDALYAENLDLKKRLGRGSEVSRVLAGVLLRPPETPYDTLVIDAGSAQGIARGDKVSAGGTVVIGIVSELYAHASRVTLYSSPGEKYDGILGGVLSIVVEGQGGGSLRAQVPSGTPVAVGDAVVLPGVFGGLSARVKSIDRGANQSFTAIYLSLPVSVSSLRTTSRLAFGGKARTLSKMRVASLSCRLAIIAIKASVQRAKL